MAARGFTEGLKTLRRDVIKLYPTGVGAGAADLTGVQKSDGAVSIVHTGTGAYTLTLTDKYNSLLGFDFNVIDAGTVGNWSVTPQAVDVSGAKTITFTVFKANTATDLTSNQTLQLEITLCNTSRAS